MKLTIGEKMAKLRREHGKTMEEVAVYLKISLEGYTKLEEDFVYPSDKQIGQLGKFYGITYDDVIEVGEE